MILEPYCDLATDHQYDALSSGQSVGSSLIQWNLFNIVKKGWISILRLQYLFWGFFCKKLTFNLNTLYIYHRKANSIWKAKTITIGNYPSGYEMSEKKHKKLTPHETSEHLRCSCFAPIRENFYVYVRLLN